MTDTSTPAGRPVRLVLTPRAGRPARVPLLTFIHQGPEFRASVRDAGGGRTGGRPGFSDAVIIAVLAQGLLPGLFNLVQSWVDQQRTEVSVRVQAGDVEVELQVNGRTNATALVEQASEAFRQAARDATPADPAPPPGQDPGRALPPAAGGDAGPPA